MYTGFNFILGLPIIFYGIQDRDLSARFVQDNPEVISANKLCALSALPWSESVHELERLRIHVARAQAYM